MRPSGLKFKVRLRVFLLALSLLLASFSQAGHYVITYTTSGTFSVTNGYPASQSYYPANPSDFHGTAQFTGMFLNQGSSGSSFSATGDITAHAHWVSDGIYGDTVAPGNVIVVEKSHVNITSDTSLIGSGIVGDDMGHVVSSPSSGSWTVLDASGHKYSKLSGAATDTITKSVNPYIYVANAHYPAVNAGIQATVTYTLDIYPVTLDFIGAYPDGDHVSLSVGQRVIASVSPHGLGGSGDTYTWSTPSAGNPFADYLTSKSGATFYPFVLPGTSASSLSCHFANPSTPIFSCTYYNAFTGLSITLNRPLPIQAPTINGQSAGVLMGIMRFVKPGYNLEPTDDYIWHVGDGDPAAFLLFGAHWDSATWGVYDPNKVSDPIAGWGPGKWGYVQFYSDTGGTPSTLDGNFPYDGGGWFDADGDQLGLFEDAPGFIALPSSGATFNSSFNRYIFYKAYDTVAGTSCYVPLLCQPWVAKGVWSSSSGVWSQADTGSTNNGAAHPYPWPFPIW